MIIKRDSYLNRMIHNMWNGEVKVITGIRRCGKSVLLFDLFNEYLLSQEMFLLHLRNNFIYFSLCHGMLQRISDYPLQVFPL